MLDVSGVEGVLGGAGWREGSGREVEPQLLLLTEDLCRADSCSRPAGSQKDYAAKQVFFQLRFFFFPPFVCRRWSGDLTESW